MKTFTLCAALSVSLLSLACSQAEDPIGQGSAHFTVDVAAAEFDQCSFTSTGGIGLETSDGSSPVPELPVGDTPPTYFGNLVTDGTPIIGGSGDYKVDCKILGDDSLSISIELGGPNNSPNASATAQGKAGITINGSIGSDGTGAAGINVFTPDAGATSSTVDCILKAVPKEGTIDDFGLSAGEATFTFLCPQASQSLNDFGVCELRGTVKVIDCIKESK